MACHLCEHCSGPVTIAERVICKGYSYHKECQKCYFCNEPNLQGVETFMGLLFCSACSDRIFHSITPDSNPDQYKPTENENAIATDQKLNSNRERSPKKLPTSISGYHTCDYVSKYTKSRPVPSPPEQAIELKYIRRRKTGPEERTKKCIQDAGMLTDVTQNSLFRTNESRRGTSQDRTINYQPCRDTIRSSHSPPKSTTQTKEHNVSDMRIAELGTSTEIANTALRKKSENAVIIKSVTCLRKATSSTPSVLNSDISGDGSKTWTETTYISSSNSKRYGINKEIRNMLKLSYKNFKRNIIRQSSVVSTLMSVEEPQSILQKINSLFHEDINEHQRRGLKRLYSTINRQNPPQKLGWLHSRRKTPERLGCKHVVQSHSYRCMRANVMRSAGPTKSELAVFRAKVKKLMVPALVRDPNMDKNCSSSKISEDCGSCCETFIKIKNKHRNNILTQIIRKR